jgi:hypothetical protein
MGPKRIIAAAFLPVAAAATVAVPGISFVVQPVRSRDRSVQIHASNITSEPITYVRLEVTFLAQLGPNVFASKPFRQNAMCPCEAKCELKSLTLTASQQADFSWDLLSDTCRPAEPGRYRVQLVNECSAEGCLGAYYIGTGDQFTIEP